MATTCTIEIEGVDYALIYKHYDGYPEVMLEPLKRFNEDFEANRGDDPEYKFAQLLRNKEIASLDDSKYTGWGVIPYSNDTGTNYRYILLSNGDVKVKEN